MSRFDGRSKDQFKKDIRFSTMLEAFFFDMVNKKEGFQNVRDNGVCNNGEFVECGQNTSGADYMIDAYGYTDMPLEIKWVPTYGKFTLKVHDLNAYTKEEAAILFIYTSKLLPLKKPKDYNLDAHIKLINHNKKFLKWGIMFPVDVKAFLDSNTASNNIKPIYYMGGKKGIVLPQCDFGLWFKEETF
jgi:hypothetical protein